MMMIYAKQCNAMQCNIRWRQQNYCMHIRKYRYTNDEELDFLSTLYVTNWQVRGISHLINKKLQLMDFSKKKKKEEEVER